MSAVFVVFGALLAAAGLFFAFRGIAHDKAGADGLKTFSVSGPSWLILVAIGVAVAVGGPYLWKEQQSDPPPTTTTVEAEPYTYGDDGVLDTLWDACSMGDMGSCDSLYQASPVDSEYEMFGMWCGYLYELPVAPVDEGKTCAAVSQPETTEPPTTS